MMMRGGGHRSSSDGAATEFSTLASTVAVLQAKMEDAKDRLARTSLEDIDACCKLAEFISITHGGEGIKVSVLCPQGVNTAMAPKSFGDGQTDGVIEPEELAQTVVEAIREERFHVLPHAEVEEYVRRKGDDVDRWLVGMRRLKRKSQESQR